MNILTSLAPRSSARHKTARNASYSAWLFKVGKDNAWETSIKIPSLFSRMIHAPLPIKLKAPSMKIVHYCVLSGGAGEVISAIKSVTA